MAHVMLNSKRLSFRLWVEAISIACHIKNRVYLRLGMEMTPYELWKGKKPNLSYLHNIVPNVTTSSNTHILTSDETNDVRNKIVCISNDNWILCQVVVSKLPNTILCSLSGSLSVRNNLVYCRVSTLFQTPVGSPAKLDDVAPPVAPSDVPGSNLQPIVTIKKEDEAHVEPQVTSVIETQNEFVDVGMKKANAPTVETNLTSEPLVEPSVESNAIANVEPLEEPPVVASVEIGVGIENRDAEEYVTMGVELNIEIGVNFEPYVDPHIAAHGAENDVDPKHKPNLDYDPRSAYSASFYALEIRHSGSLYLCKNYIFNVLFIYLIMLISQGLKKQKGDEMERKLPPIKVTPKLVKGHTPPAPVDPYVATTTVAVNMDYIQFLKQEVQDIQKLIQELTDKEKRYTIKIAQLEAQCEEDIGSH
ncbi:hypothetical protein Pfo_018082 [Paulownia fortunei]|nr:hypothetical protein Pfo_018082 [Paulownia fortunei]